MKSKSIRNQLLFKDQRAFSLVITLFFVFLISSLFVAYFMDLQKKNRIRSVENQFSVNEILSRQLLERCLGKISDYLFDSTDHFPMTNPRDGIDFVMRPKLGRKMQLDQVAFVSETKPEDSRWSSKDDAQGTFFSLIQNKKIDLSWSSWETIQGREVFRYAVSIKDLSGLLDPLLIHPHAGTYYEAGVKLSEIPGMSKAMISLFQNWLWSSNIANWNEVYAKRLRNQERGILSEERTFFSEKDFRNFLVANGAERLETFFVSSRRTLNRPLIDCTTKAVYSFDKKKGFSYDYKRDQGSAWDQGRSNYNVDFSRLMNSQGKRLMRKRFPLVRLRLLDNPSQNPDQIYDYFGLRKVGNYWVYDHGARSNNKVSVYALNDPLFPNREPDFFELLQAGILTGSLGQMTDPSNPNNVVFLNERDRQSSIQNHLIQIGANIIDQWDQDSIPTGIKINDQLFSGIENIPYLNEILLSHYRPTKTAAGGKANNAARDSIWSWWMFEVWNPHQSINAQNLKKPTKYRIIPTGGGSGFGISVAPGKVGYKQSIWFPYQGDRSIEFTDSEIYRNPSILRSANNVSPLGSEGTATSIDLSDNGTIVDSSGIYFGGSGGVPNVSYGGSVNELGIFMGKINSATALPLPDQYWNLWSGYYATGASAAGTSGPVFELQYFFNNQWIPYQQFTALAKAPFSTVNPPSPGGVDVPLHTMSYKGWIATLDYHLFGFNQNSVSWIDPRTTRISVGGGPLNPNNPLYPQALIKIGFGLAYPCDGNGDYFMAIAPGNGTGAINDPIIGTRGCSTPIDYPYFAINNPSKVSGKPYYLDRDGVVRLGDVDYSAKDYFWSDVSPRNSARYLGDQGVNSRAAGLRPVVLNREFNSVAEIAYAHRDLPFRSLNFWDQNSADLRLLDLFSIEDEGEISSIRAFPGSMPKEVLRAICSGKKVNESQTDRLGEQKMDLENLLSTFEEIKDQGKAGDWVTFTQAFSSYLEKQSNLTKEERESFVRSISERVQFDTWTFMIEIFLQTGKVPEKKGSDAAIKKMTTSKESWKVAMDIRTGKVITIDREYQ